MRKGWGGGGGCVLRERERERERKKGRRRGGEQNKCLLITPTGKLGYFTGLTCSEHSPLPCCCRLRPLPQWGGGGQG